MEAEPMETEMKAETPFFYGHYNPISYMTHYPYANYYNYPYASAYYNYSPYTYTTTANYVHAIGKREAEVNINTSVTRF